MKKQHFSLFIIALFLGVLFLNAFMVVPAAEAKGTETRIRLTGRGQYANASGKAKYKVDGANREFQVELENATQLSGQKVFVYANNSKVGAFVVSSLGAGRLNRSTQRGQNVPTIKAGSVVQIKTGAGVVIVAGSF